MRGKTIVMRPSLKHIVCKAVIAGLLLISLINFYSCKKSCRNQEIQKIMGDLYKRKIAFPEQIELLNKSGVDAAWWSKINTTEPVYYIVHFFMADCDKCVNELQQAQQFIEKHKTTAGVRYIFIASGPTRLFAEEAIHKAGFTMPVYYEKEYFSFKKLNNLPLADRLYNTMLLNNRNEVILFGELFQNKKAETLFFNAIDMCNN